MGSSRPSSSQNNYFMNNVQPRIVEFSCLATETIQMNFIANQITDANVVGQIAVRFKSNQKAVEVEKAKKVPIEIVVEDNLWQNESQMQQILNSEAYKIQVNKMVAPVANYYKFLAPQFNTVNSSEAVHPILQYKMNAKLISMMPVQVNWY